MTPLEELAQLVREKGRRIFVSENPVDLRDTVGTNCVYVLQLPEAFGSAGGRVGGIGERRLQKLYCFRLESGEWIKVYETDNDAKLEKFELPYHAAGLTIVLEDGTGKVVSGVIDREFIQAYNSTV